MNNKEIDDVDDDLFVSRKPQNYIFDETKDKTSQRLLNCKNLVQESEQAGGTALEQLAVQRESLDRAESGLDSINAMNRVTQKHLNNMRSFFGGIKSLFYDASKDNQIKNEVQGLPRSSTVANFPYGSPVAASNSSTTRSGSSSSSNQGNRTTFQNNPSNNNFPRNAPVKPGQPVDEFENDLDELGMGLGRLKELAMKLGDEIGDQNEQLDRITDKTDRAGDSIKLQNRHMQQLLKK